LGLLDRAGCFRSLLPSITVRPRKSTPRLTLTRNGTKSVARNASSVMAATAVALVIDPTSMPIFIERASDIVNPIPTIKAVGAYTQSCIRSA
jgi:hypothetical protein